MKYYLIIGYQLLEKYREFPTVRVRLNGQLVDEFLCDNEQTTEISVQAKYSSNYYGTCHNRKWDSIETSRYMTPAKYKMIELDATSWPDKGELTIEVSNNNSNYNNGFMTLRSIVWITPVILIRKDIHDNISILHRIMKKIRQMRTKEKSGNFFEQSRATWPGISTYQDRSVYKDRDTRILNGKLLFQSELHRGGNFNLHFEIRKKHKTYMLVDRGTHTKGYFQIDLFFLAWYEHHSKNYLDFIIENNVDLDGQV